MKIIFVVLFCDAINKCLAFGSGSVFSGIFEKAVEVVNDNKCVRHLQQSKLFAENFTIWAVQMLDATDKFPTGIFYGSFHHLGNFDECISVSNYDLIDNDSTGPDSRELIIGKYCLSTIELKHSLSSRQHFCEGSSCSAWERIQPASHRFEISRHRVQWAVCMPASCSARDIQKMIKGLLTDVLDIRVNVNVDEKMCQTMDTIHTEGIWPYFGVLVGLYFSFIATCVWIKKYSNKFSGSSWVTVFDAKYHWDQLMDTSSTADASISCIHGFKVIGIILIVFSHRFESLVVGPLLNTQEIDEIYISIFKTMSLNGTLIVDVFFTIGGFLLCWNLQKTKEKLSLNFGFIILYRYIRLSSVLVVVIFFQAFLLYDLSNGPLWPAKIGQERDNCLNNWWTNILFINNYVYPEYSCNDPTWYLAVEFQLFILGNLLFLIMEKWKRGYTGLILVLIVSITIPFIVTYVKNLDPTYMADAYSMGRDKEDVTYISSYIVTHCRAGPYFVGMTFAYWLYSMQSSNTKLSKWVLSIGWVLSVLAIVSVFCVAVLFYQPHVQMNRALVALYAGFHRPIFAAGIGFIITACALGQGGVMNWLLSWRCFRPLSKLVYSIFLCHSLVQMFEFASTRTRVYMSNTYIAWYTVSDIVISTGIAAVLYITVEKPLLDLVTMLRKCKQDPSKWNTNKSAG